MRILILVVLAEAEPGEPCPAFPLSPPILCLLLILEDHHGYTICRDQPVVILTKADNASGRANRENTQRGSAWMGVTVVSTFH